eukprot:3920573-Alexandrium_andersonii.AAC.1
MTSGQRYPLARPQQPPTVPPDLTDLYQEWQMLPTTPEAPPGRVPGSTSKHSSSLAEPPTSSKPSIGRARRS